MPGHIKLSFLVDRAALVQPMDQVALMDRGAVVNDAEVADRGHPLDQFMVGNYFKNVGCLIYKIISMRG